MKILFVVQGEGRGHLTQALSLRQKLLKDGHTIVGVLVGKSPARRIPSFFTDKIEAPVYSFESPNFLPTAKNKQVNMPKTIAYNLLRQHKYIAGIRFVRRMIKETEAEVVVNFYELLTGLAYLLLPPKAHMISIAHQYLFLHPDFEFPNEARLHLASLRFFTRMTTIGATKILALSFRKMRELPNARMVVVPPLLRSEVLAAKAEKGNYLHGYLLNSGFAEEVKNWHEKNPDVVLHFFWDKKGVSKKEDYDDKLSFHQLDDKLFVDYMARSKAYATTAGFESVCEAMYLGKPVLMIPTHIEQACNAFDAMQSGAGVVSDTFDMDALLELSDNHKVNADFQYWVKQSDWLVLREFREDLLQGEIPLGLFHRLFINWIARLGKSLSI
ncbi:glycosyltransferase family protein [Massilibacteroides sp.]|uniref:glycosyltransferase family protein n=1 Tax=Massilibacteroides sp. TaxID=2034766 RepID=UPI00261EF61A|nr:glycosyltransferase family protein [Massilibacteroides sp.]MDD4515545.1 glycosyltransferase family protein [Massilibacteroides sp.]